MKFIATRATEFRRLLLDFSHCSRQRPGPPAKPVPAIRVDLLACCVAAVLSFPVSIFAQGSLAPPGAPGASMKSLAQIEPRTPISSLPFTIGSPGSYYLTQNLNMTSGDGVTINADGVTLDLNGFTISSTASPNSGSGIVLGGNADVTDITIFNGHIKGEVAFDGSMYAGPGFNNGISAGAFSFSNVHIRQISVTGCRQGGINVGTGSTAGVDHCFVDVVGGIGIAGQNVSDSIAYDCGGVAINAHNVSSSVGSTHGTYGILTVTTINSCGTSDGTADGILAQTALNCYGTANSGAGVDAFDAENCQGSSGSGDGVAAHNAQGCHGSSTSKYGILADTALNCYATSNGGSAALYAKATASNCYGENSSGNGTGLLAAVANSCYGKSVNGTGLDVSESANACYGESTAGTGLHSLVIAIGCVGKSGTGTGLSAFSALTCRGTNNNGVSESITNKHLMP